jgi:hypothetical protein
MQKFVKKDVHNIENNGYIVARYKRERERKQNDE